MCRWGESMEFSNEIRVLMVKKDVTHTELAKRLEISPSNLTNKMKLDNWRLDDLNNIANALDAKLIVKLG